MQPFCMFEFCSCFDPVIFVTHIRKYLIELLESLNYKVMCEPRIISLENQIINLMDVGDGVVLEMRDGIGALW